MALRDWIAAFPVPGVATVATPATFGANSRPPVATVATVASVTVGATSQSASVADPWAEFAPAILSGALQQCQACRHFTGLIPADGDNLGVPDAGWCRRFNTATHPLTPFWCDGYSPLQNTDEHRI
jgi:hypothetical protein